MFLRDSVSLQLANDKGCKAPVMEFGPDGAFGTGLRDDVTADAFLKQNHLEPGKFLCCIPGGVLKGELTLEMGTVMLWFL